MTRPILTGITAIALLSCNNSREEPTMNTPDSPSSDTPNGLYISTAAESAERAGQLPTEPSEDVSSILGTLELPEINRSEDRDYLPTPALEWIIQAKLEQALDVKEIAKRFGRDWRSKYGGLTIYGLDTATNRWTFLVSADGPEKVSALQFAWNYYASWSDDGLATKEMYDSRLKAVKQELSSLTSATVSAEVSPQDAVNKALKLSNLTDDYDRTVAIRLVAPRGQAFKGKEFWDVMLCLGLRWGDMDCFHWVNDSGHGDDFFFSVWTNTAPGYFFPEDVAAGSVKVEDLVFGYSIPRNADPVEVYQRMLKAVQYAQKRLGGTITAEDGSPLDSDATLTEIKRLTKELTDLGFKPGTSPALQQF